MNKRLIEFIAVAIFVAIFSKGLFFGILTGVCVAVLKKAWNQFTPIEKHFSSPFESVGIAALASLIVSLLKILF